MLLKTISNERITTNWLLLDDLDLWYLFDSKSLKQEVEKKYFAIIKAILDGQITIATDWLETEEAKEYFNTLANYDSEIFQSLTDEWDNILNGAYDNVDELLDKIYEIGKEKGYSNIRETIRWANADKEAIQLAKDYNYHLIRKLSNDLRNNIRDKITEGVIGNVNPLTLAGEIRDLGVKPLPGNTLSPYQRGVMIARTETSRMQNTGMLQSYINEGYIEVKILTAEDDNVCRTCLEYAFEFNNDDKIIFSNRGEERVHNIIDLIKGGCFPPFHPNCRCTYLTVWESKGEPPENPYIIDLTYVGNWMYEYGNTRYFFQGNTPQGRDKFQQKYGVDVDKLNDLSLKFLMMYTDDADRAINNKLRKRWEDDECEKLWNKTYKKLFGNEEQKLTFDKALEIYEEIFEKYSKTLKEDIIVCRREKNRFMGNEENPDRYTDKGFTSTSIHGYVEKYGDEINYILIPAGTKVIYLEEITRVDEDYEILFAPGIDLTRVEDLSPRKKVWRIIT